MNFNALSTTGTAPSSRTWHATQLLSDNKRFCVYGGFNGERALDDLYIFSSSKFLHYNVNQIKPQ